MRLSNLLVNSSILIGLVLIGRNILSRGHASLAAESQEESSDMLDNENYIRELAYQIWESEGWPEGQARRHWEMAAKLSKLQEGCKE